MALPSMSPTLVGRDAELDTLTTAMRDARGGEFVTVLLGGEAGVGKTRLVNEFAARSAPSRVTTLMGQCVELGEDGLPYAPIAGVVRAMVKQLGHDEVLRLAGAGAPAVARLVAELDTAAPPTAADGRGLLFDGFTALLERASEQQPLVIVIEDLHWADGSTRDLLRFLVRSLSGARILLVLTYRTDEVVRSHPLRPFLAELDRLRSVRRLAVPRFTLTEVGAQMQAISGTWPKRGVLEQVHGRSEGVPFFVEELLSAGDGGKGLPDPLRDLLLVRTESLSKSARETLQTLAVGGQRVRHTLLADVSEQSAEDLDASVYEAVAAGIVYVDGDDYVFRHALLREAVHDDMVPGAHARVHLRYADVLEKRTDAGDADANSLAHHLDNAHQGKRAFAAYVRAGADLMSRYAFREAQLAYEHALDLWHCDEDAHTVIEHPELLQRTASAAVDAGELERGLSLLEAALEDTERAGDAVRGAELVTLRSRVLGDLGRPEDVTTLQRLLCSLPDPTTKIATNTLRQLSSRHMCEARFDEAIECAESVIAKTDDPEIHLAARLVLGASLVHVGSIDRGLEILQEAKLTTNGVSPRNCAVAHVNLSDGLNLVGRYDEAAQVALEGVDQAREHGLARTLGAMMAGNTAEPLLALGQWDQADELITGALELDPPTRHLWQLSWEQAWLYLWRGEIDRAAETIAPTRTAMANYRVEPQYAVPVARTAAEVELAAGDAEAAWRMVANCLEQQQSRSPAYDLALLAVGARALGQRSHDGDVDESATKTLRSRLDGIGEWGPSAVWRSLIEAELAGDVGDDPDAWRVVVDQVRWPAHLVPYAHYRLAHALTAAGDRAGAAKALDTATSQAESLGSGWLLQLTADLARRTGTGRSPRDNGGSDGHLTTREREVLRLIADGRTNGQIADELFISVKTASVHVSNILTKLGVSRRGEAAALARRTHLLDS